ncbi:MAG TPA: WecB/TagA/CpsF family glycosyltransferase [Steroidobacteraceae bacterium]
MTIVLRLDDYDLAGFMSVAAEFGRDRAGYVVTPNVDHLIRYCDEQMFRDLYHEAAFTLLDSRFLSHLIGLRSGRRPRVCPGSDLTAALLAVVTEPDDPLVLIGGSSTQARQLRVQFGLRSLHHYSPIMGFISDPAAVEQCLTYVESHSPFRFCFLAVGSPQQEILAQRLKDRGIARGLTLCIGGSINFLTGLERRAPRWMRRLGFEWLFRLLQNPGRMARRYLIRGPRIFALLPRMQFQLREAPVVTVDAPSAAPRAAESWRDLLP